MLKFENFLLGRALEESFSNSCAWNEQCSSDKIKF